MFTKTKIAIAASLVLGSASLALADDYTDQAADALRAPVQVQALSSRPVALQNGFAVKAPNWIDRASQTESGGY